MEALAARLALIVKEEEPYSDEVLKAMGKSMGVNIEAQHFKTLEEVKQHISSMKGAVHVSQVQELMRAMGVKG